MFACFLTWKIVYILFIYIYMDIICLQCPWRPEEGGGSPGTGVIYRRWAAVWYWLELDLGPPEEHSVLSTTDPFLQSLLFNLFNYTQDFILL